MVREPTGNTAMAEVAEMNPSIKNASPEFRYRGDRNYINGATIYEATLDNLEDCGLPKADGEICLNLRKVARNHLTISYCPPQQPQPKPSDAVADFLVATGDGAIFGWLEETNRKIKDRTPFNAAVLEGLRVFEDKSVNLLGCGNFSIIQVALTSLRDLHDIIFSPSPTQKWLPAKIETKRPLWPANVDQMRIELVQSVGDRLTKSLMLVGGEIIGNIYFSLATQ